MEKLYQWFRPFCRSRREGQTKEDVHQDIFDMRLQTSTGRYPSRYLRYATEREDEKTSVRMSSSYIAPATKAQRRYLQYLLVSAISPQRQTSPFTISVENRFSMKCLYRILKRDFSRAFLEFFYESTPFFVCLFIVY